MTSETVGRRFFDGVASRSSRRSEPAYRRDDALKKRRELMTAWGD